MAGTAGAPTAHTLRPRRPARVFLAGCCVLRAASAAVDKGKLTMLWPIQFTSLPLSPEHQGAPALETEAFASELRRLGLRGFNRYVSTTLPREMELDKEFAEDFGRSDHTRVNHGFCRWQRRVFADQESVPVDDISLVGEATPRLEGVNYTWPALYQSSAFRKLNARIAQLTRSYMQNAGYERARIPAQFRVFVWVEVYKSGDALRPTTLTSSAYVAGRYFTSCERESQKLNFQDPRGINPPYGKTFSYTIYPGSLVLFPTWVSQFMTPNMRNNTCVSYVFLVYPAEGTALHWKDDYTASMKVLRDLKLPPAGKRRGP